MHHLRDQYPISNESVLLYNYHVILSDEGAEEFKKYLKEGRCLVPISDIIEKGNIPALLHTLVEVKEENKDEQ